MITTVCNLACPYCCCSCGVNKVGKHCDVNDILGAGKILGDLDELHITGGEPTLHPSFAMISERIRYSFRARKYILNTNGTNIRDNIRYLYNYDWIQISYLNNIDLPELPNLRVTVEKKVHFPNDPTKSRPCGRESIAAWLDNRIFPCCVAPGISNAASIEFKDNWRNELAKVKLPCRDCMFALS
jgi:organic radical activating enzyme